MKKRNTPLRGCSSVLLPDGTEVQVSDYDGNMMIDEELWADCKRRIAARLEKLINDRVKYDAALCDELGLDVQKSVTISLTDFLREKKAPNSGTDTVERRENEANA